MLTLLTASQLTNLLQILGALVADYIENPKKPMRPELRPYVKTVLQWKDVPSLGEAISTAVKGGDKMSALYDVGQELRASFADFRANAKFTTPELTMLKALASYLVTDSDTALNYVKKNAGVFGSPELAQVFLPEIPKADNNALRKVVKGLVGRDGTHLTLDESKLLKETNPKEYGKYVDLRKAHNAEFKATLANYVRASGKDKVDYQTVYKYMVAQGFTHSMVPGFQGLIDDQGKWYTKGGELIAGVPNLSTYVEVQMNDGRDPEAKWVFKAVKPDGTYAYAYTTNFRRDQSSSKYQHVADLMQKLPEIRAGWLQKLKKFNIEDKMSVCAVVLEILYTFAARIGSAPGRGAGTLLVKNSSETQQGINLAYIGKDSIPTKHIIKASNGPEQALLIKALHQLRAGKTPSMPLYTYKQGNRLIKVSPSDVNKAFHAFGAPAEVTVHKLRTCRGTTLFRQLMEKDSGRRPPSTEKEALQRWKDMTEQVGKLLNHKRGVGTETEKVTGATAALSYIDSSLQLDLWSRWGFRPPVALEKLLMSDS